MTSSSNNKPSREKAEISQSFVVLQTDTQVQLNDSSKALRVLNVYDRSSGRQSARV